jgi:hypothetical protein
MREKRQRALAIHRVRGDLHYRFRYLIHRFVADVRVRVFSLSTFLARVCVCVCVRARASFSIKICRLFPTQTKQGPKKDQK